MKPEHRKLTFSSMNQIMEEVDRLLKRPYDQVGNWSLGQINKHLTEAITFSIDGYPTLAPWLIRKTIGPFMARDVIKKGVFPKNIKLPDQFAPMPGLDARAEAEALRASINYYESYSGPMAIHPLADKFSREEWTKFHLIHAAHHLGFLVPKTV